MKPPNPFLEASLSEIPRLLGLLNRNPLSKTYGSFDRNFWHYRTNDISCARLQEATLTLALLYKNNFEGNIYYNDPKLLEWIDAAIDFTISLQHKDGSYDEWYKNERSFVATAFVTAAFAEIARELDKNLITHHDKLLVALEKSALWLSKNIPSDIPLNQLSGGIYALAAIGKLTGNEKYTGEAKNLQKKFISLQTSEGWWSEYGGPDIGYLSLTIDYLSKYYLLTNDENTIRALTKAILFIKYFMHPNGTTGGEYGSRNTEYLIPSGFVLIDSKLNEAAGVVSFILRQLKNGSGILPRNLDERYLCHNLYTWLQAGLAYKNFQGSAPENHKSIYFPEAGIRIISTETYVCIINLKKGGVFRLFSLNDSRNAIDSGIELAWQNKKLISQGYDVENKVESLEQSASVEGNMKFVKESLMTTPVLIVFKTFQYVVGSLPSIIGQQVKKIIRKKIITGISQSSITFERKFNFTPTTFSVEDSVGLKISPEKIRTGHKASYTFVPSSKLFFTEEMSKFNLIPKVSSRETEKETIIQRTFIM